VSKHTLISIPSFRFQLHKANVPFADHFFSLSLLYSIHSTSYHLYRMPPLVPTTTIDNSNSPTVVRPEDIAITSQIHPFIISNQANNTSSSSPATTPPLVSPSLLVPLKSSPKPASSGPIRQVGFNDTASQYNQVLEKLESANIQDKQMLSSFKRM